MTYTYSKVEDIDADVTERWEIEEGGLPICIVFDEEVARLFSVSDDLLFALERLVHRERVEAASCGFSDDEMTWLEEARAAIAKATGA